MSVYPRLCLGRSCVIAASQSLEAFEYVGSEFRQDLDALVAKQDAYAVVAGDDLPSAKRRKV